MAFHLWFSEKVTERTAGTTGRNAEGTLTQNMGYAIALDASTDKLYQYNEGHQQPSPDQSPFKTVATINNERDVFVAVDAFGEITPMGKNFCEKNGWEVSAESLIANTSDFYQPKNGPSLQDAGPSITVEAVPTADPSSPSPNTVADTATSASPTVPTPLSTEDEEDLSLSDSFNRAAKKKKLLQTLSMAWGITEIGDAVYDDLARYVDADKTKWKRGKGFELSLLDGHSIEWQPANEAKKRPEAIKGPALGFKQDDAEAMVALARAHGWKQIALDGQGKHKDMLWLAVQRQNLHDKEAFEAGQADGSIPPTDEKGKPNNFVPLRVVGYNPPNNIVKQWERELEELNASKNQGPSIAQAAASSQPAPQIPADTGQAVDKSKFVAPAITSPQAPLPPVPSTPARKGSSALKGP